MGIDRKMLIEALLMCALAAVLVGISQIDYVRTRNHEIATCMTKGE